MTIAPCAHPGTRRELPHGDRLARLPDRLRGPLQTRQRIFRSIPVPGVARNIEVKFASTRSEWEEAFHLVADNYRARGYEEASADCHFTSYHALPDTVVLVAKLGGQVVATMSVVPDNPLLGLPLEDLYRLEVQELRRQGRRLAETGSLAERGLTAREFRHVFTALMQLAWQHQMQKGNTTAVIAVNPRHSNFYTRVHGFLPLGPRRAYVRVQGHPAEGFFLDPLTMAVRAPDVHQKIFGVPLPAEVLVAPPMPEHLVYYFAARSSQTRLGMVEQIRWHTVACGSPRRW
jgi:hypothetical protein